MTAVPWLAAPRSRIGSHAVLPLATVAGAVFVLMSQMLGTSRRTARLCYWTGSAVTTALLVSAMAVSGRPVGQLVLAAVLCVVLAVGLAYFVGWQLKIGGRTRSVFVSHTRPDPPEDGSEPPPPPPLPANSYNGVLTAEGIWWIAVILIAMIAADVYLFGWIWQAVLGTAALTVMGFSAGVDDATRQLPVVRGQKMQGVIAAVASALLFFLPAVAYVIGYLVGKRHPMGYGLRDPLAQHNAEDDA
ncbi:hypothetical protein [Candidatus Mycolicibacterium alkanivorans]|uniref:Uncharacterized protein n=1 Tax=Candidatus Mycolicibacterium alkanivorans TaxID=2954114 RepID=A0ABS9YQX2_9MYCO|nr:hypothetical protein [Candidatus Mycolicibacterium alkanivorans]MCI4673647.1 hypothetical protein [Candidatus Mycolicibacterium alkanivorans]